MVMKDATSLMAPGHKNSIFEPKQHKIYDPRGPPKSLPNLCFNRISIVCVFYNVYRYKFTYLSTNLISLSVIISNFSMTTRGKHCGPSAVCIHGNRLLGNTSSAKMAAKLSMWWSVRVSAWKPIHWS